MFIPIIIVLVGFAYVVANVIQVLIRNIIAHRFFKTQAPKLPVLPNKNIFSGHLCDVLMHDKNWLTIHKLHEQYGPTFGLYCANQPWVSTKDLDLIKLVELDRPMRHINRAKFLGTITEFNDSFAFVDDDDWKRRRRVMAPAFTNRKVRSDEITTEFNANLELLRDGINYRMTDKDGDRSATLNASDMFARFTLAVILSVFYGQNDRIDFIANKDSWTSAYDEANRRHKSPLIQMSIIFPVTVPILRFLLKFHKIGKIKDQVVQYIIDLTRAIGQDKVKRNKNSSEASLASSVPLVSSGKLDLESNHKRRLVDPIIDALFEKRINHNEFVCDLYLLFLAGFHTTADTITCLVWHLAQYPHIQEQLRKSILEQGIDSEYLSWCIQETIRIHPAVPLGLGRILGEDVTVNGLFLPKGTFIMPSIYSIHHDPTIWSEPEQFKPDRWRDTSGHHPAAFMGFGLGPRNCVGGKFAVQEIKLVMQMLVINYKIEKCPETVDKYAFSSPAMLFTYPDQEIKVRMVER